MKSLRFSLIQSIKETGKLFGAMSDAQMKRTEELIKATGQPYTSFHFHDMVHEMHLADPDLYVKTFTDWEKTLPTESETRNSGVFG